MARFIGNRIGFTELRVWTRGASRASWAPRGGKWGGSASPMLWASRCPGRPGGRGRPWRPGVRGASGAQRPGSS
eukprot:5796710-Pyramimonas_sp.AAC.1